jgi:hypothetical protein
LQTRRLNAAGLADAVPIIGGTARPGTIGTSMSFADSPFIRRLLAGPNNVELSPSDMALLEAHLRQPVSFATIQREKKATGHSPTEAAQNKLKLIRDFNRRLHQLVAASTPAEPVTARTPTPRPKRSTEQGEGQVRLVAALALHHKYADGGCLNLEPIGNNELARLAGVGSATALRFFEKWFKGHAKYRSICMRDVSKLIDTIKAMRGEFIPSNEPNYGVAPYDERERDD